MTGMLTAEEQVGYLFAKADLLLLLEKVPERYWPGVVLAFLYEGQEGDIA